MDVKKRQIFEHELRRLRREGDETISMHAKKVVAVKVSRYNLRITSDLIDFKPSMTQCRICFIHNAVPFIGFGFLDNAVMIVAGDYIDSTLGVAFHISGFKLLLKLKKIKVCSPGRCGTREHTLRCRGYILWWLCRVVG